MKKRFSNPPGGIPQKVNPFTILEWLWQLATSSGKEGFSPDHVLPKNEARQSFLDSRGKNSLTWIGHSTFWIRLGGTELITDPFFSRRASPVQFIGPKRMFPPGLTIEELGTPDMMLVSHNHYDHLDDRAVRSFKEKDKISVVVPAGLGKFFKKRGYSNVAELRWGEVHETGDVRITALPAIHFSARGFFDRNKTLWCGYLIEAGGKKIYFSGDTAYHSVFKGIGKKFFPIDIALVPIGAYEPREFMSPVHTNPEEAVQLGRDLQAQTLVGMHWGTVRLTIEPPAEPPGRFLVAGSDAGYEKDDLWVMRIGETRALPAE